MDLVAQIVATKGNVEVEEIRRELQSCRAETISLKSLMLEELNDSRKFYLRCCMLERCPKFSTKLSRLVDSCSAVKEQILSVKMNNHIVISDLEMSAMFAELEDIFAQLDVLHKVDNMETLVMSVDKLCEADPLSAADNLMVCKRAIRQDMKSGDFQNLYRCLFEKCCQALANFRLSLIRRWSNSISTVCESGCGNLKTNKLTVKFVGDLSLKDIFGCLTITEYRLVETFGKIFFDSFLRPALLYPCEVDSFSTSSRASLSLSFYQGTGENQLENTVSTLTQVLAFMNQHLNLYCESESFIESLGLECQDRFASLLTEAHLIKVDLENSEDILRCKELLLLLSNGFISKDSDLIKYLNNLVDDPQIVMMPQALATVFTILEENLLDSHLTEPMEIFFFEDENQFNCEATSTAYTFKMEGVTKVDFLNETHKKFLFPKCQVSKSMKKLIIYMEGLIIKSLEEVKLRATLWRLVNEMVHLYMASVKLQPSCSLYSALIYNNSMYLAVNLIHFEKTYHTRLPLSGLVYKLQNVAVDKVNEVVKDQEETLLKALHSSGLLESFEMTKLPNETARLIRKCLRQLQDLCSVWREVLPSDICNIALGYLCGKMIKDITSMVLLTNSIDPNVKSSLFELFSFISDGILQILKVDEGLEKYIKDWGKWRALVEMLKSYSSVMVE